MSFEFIIYFYSYFFPASEERKRPPLKDLELADLCDDEEEEIKQKNVKIGKETEAAHYFEASDGCEGRDKLSYDLYRPS